jgi:hypothetical protein
MRTSILRRLRGVVTTAVLWAPVWALAGASMATYDIYRMHQWQRMRQYELQRTQETTSADHAAIAWHPLDHWEYLAEKALAFAVVGVVSGAVFAIVLAALERRRALADLAMGRIAAWGALGGMTLPLIMLPYVLSDLTHFPEADAGRQWLVLSGLMGALGAACSTATLALARRPVPTRDGT